MFPKVTLVILSIFLVACHDKDEPTQQDCTITFKGYISNEEVINEEFVVGADCCHVSLISGNTEIILD